MHINKQRVERLTEASHRAAFTLEYILNLKGPALFRNDMTVFNQAMRETTELQEATKLVQDVLDATPPRET